MILLRESFTNYKNTENPIYAKNYITTITEDQEGTLWFGTFGDGLYAFDKNNSSYIQIIKPVPTWVIQLVIMIYSRFLL